MKRTLLIAGMLTLTGCAAQTKLQVSAPSCAIDIRDERMLPDDRLEIGMEQFSMRVAPIVCALDRPLTHAVAPAICDAGIVGSGALQRFELINAGGMVRGEVVVQMDDKHTLRSVLKPTKWKGQIGNGNNCATMIGLMLDQIRSTPQTSAGAPTQPD